MPITNHLIDSIVANHPVLGTPDGAAALREVVNALRCASKAAVLADLQLQLSRAFKKDLEVFDNSEWPVFSRGLVRAATVSAYDLALELVEHFGRGETVAPEPDPDDPEPAAAYKEAA